MILCMTPFGYCLGSPALDFVFPWFPGLDLLLGGGGLKEQRSLVLFIRFQFNAWNWEIVSLGVLKLFQAC